MKKTILRQSLTALCFLSIGLGEAYGKAPAPYGGGAIPIPGTIEVEDFDKGEEGSSYHDEDSINDGGSYRTDVGVDIDTSGNGGFVVGWTKKGGMDGLHHRGGTKHRVHLLRHCSLWP